MSEGISCYCKTCKKTMDGANFYTSRNLEKYPYHGKLEECKKCITRHVDNWDPSTYVWIIKELDIPYVPEEWNTLLLRYASDPAKLKGTTILGRYISKMRLNQYAKYTYKDSEYITEVLRNKKEASLLAAGYTQDEANEILKNDSKNVEPPESYKEYLANKIASEVTPPVKPPVGDGQSNVSDNPNIPEESEYDYFGVNSQENDIVESLTDEDKTMLSLKWGVSYKPYEWVQLEQLWTDMMNSYDIQTAGHKDTLKLICKTSLKANQLLDLGDVDGYQKIARVYDSLMKSGNFTALQNKGNNGGEIDSIGELVEICESQGFIPKYYTEDPQDKVDETLADIKRYIKTLIYEETNLGTLIEQAIKDIEEEAKNEKKMEEELGSTYDEDDIDVNMNTEKDEPQEEYKRYYIRTEEFNNIEKQAREEEDKIVEDHTEPAPGTYIWR